MNPPSHLNIGEARELEEMGFKGEFIDRVEEFYVNFEDRLYRIIDRSAYGSCLVWVTYNDSKHYRIFTATELRALAPTPPSYMMARPYMKSVEGCGEYISVKKDCPKEFDAWLSRAAPVDLYFVKKGYKVTVEKEC